MKAHISHKKLLQIWQSVPTDYYQKSVKNNPLQRIWHTGKLNAVLSQIESSPRKILDVGCASGWFLSRLKDEFPKATCVGVDVYKDAIHMGKKMYPDLSLQVADIHKLPFPNNSFDVLVCCEVLEHVVDPLQVLREIKRVAKPNANIIIEMDSGSPLFKLVWSVWTRLKGEVWHEAHIQIFDAKKLKQDIQTSGLKVVEDKFFNLNMAVSYKCQKV